MREHRDPVGTDVVIRGGQADNINLASTKLAGLSLAVALPWGDDWPPGVGAVPWKATGWLRGGVADWGWFWEVSKGG
jgi:hypothetical protein